MFKVKLSNKKGHSRHNPLQFAIYLYGTHSDGNEINLCDMALVLSFMDLLIGSLQFNRAYVTPKNISLQSKLHYSERLKVQTRR
ncbi:hypothetical protein STEG23_029587, partial [Scotinomys teguina]